MKIPTSGHFFVVNAMKRYIMYVNMLVILVLVFLMEVT